MVFEYSHRLCGAYIYNDRPTLFELQTLSAMSRRVTGFILTVPTKPRSRVECKARGYAYAKIEYVSVRNYVRIFQK